MWRLAGRYAQHALLRKGHRTPAHTDTLLDYHTLSL